MHSGTVLSSIRSFRWLLMLVGTVFMTSSLYMVSMLDEASHLYNDFEGESPISPFKGSSSKKLLYPQLEEQDWTRPIVHVINTRFMQHQGHLVDLARARLVLFETFCLESMVHQTVWKDFEENQSPPFLWIIKTDPDLDPSVRQEMVTLLEPYPFIYLVASNVNFGIGIHPGGWRGGEAGKDVLSSEIYTGNMEWLRQAHEVRETRLALETRIDADDGLNIRYIEVIQEEATKILSWKTKKTSSSKYKWRYWCALNHLEWSSTTVGLVHNKTNVPEHGVFVPRKAPHACVTSGLTLGISVGQKESSVPRYPHQQLFHELRVKKHHADCGKEKCLRMIADPLMAAIRSRTPTSAGMKNVATKTSQAENLSQHAVPIGDKEVSTVLKKCFRVNITKVTRTNLYVQDHLGVIVEDNLEGQCTHGHSCKNSTKDALQNLLNVVSKDASKKKTQ